MRLVVGLTVLSVAVASQATAGPYIGAFLGYADASEAWDSTTPGEPSLSPEGILVGGLAGYTFDVPVALLGLEADLTFPSLDDSGECAPAADCDVEAKLLASLRARVGVALGPVIVYGTAGPAFGYVQAESAALGGSSDSAGLAGWTLGAGIEYRNPAGVALGFEYRHSDYGSADVTLGPATGDVKLETDELRARIAISFD